jgi:hypothetical protein
LTELSAWRRLLGLYGGGGVPSRAMNRLRWEWLLVTGEGVTVFPNAAAAMAAAGDHPHLLEFRWR